MSRVYPKGMIRHCGQRGCQLAYWGYYWFADGKWQTYLIRRVSKREWRGMRIGGLYPSHVIMESGRVILTGIHPSMQGVGPPPLLKMAT